MGFIDTLLKFLVAITFDVADFFIGRIPVWGTIFDIAGGFLGLWLWGGIGTLQFAEIIDITDQIDGFIPTLTLAGTISFLTRDT
ncbi:MAG TPA: hypothetical protein VJJ79_03265 [Candidatus Nanoarchaeia archaeon]|nr:hypothetical protein [Candidatus Nanoarchaeia archaeon]